MLNKVRLQLLVAMAFAAVVIHVLHHIDSDPPPLTPMSVVKDSNEIIFKLHEVDSRDLQTSDDSPQTRMAARKRHLQKVCANLTLDEHITEQRSLEITIAYGRLKLCGMEKTASTFMKQLKFREDRMNWKRSKGGLEQFKSNDGSFKTFIIVREPYSRLLSAYIDKLYSRASWWYYGKYIIERFRYHPTTKSLGCGSDVTFPEFIRFWIHSQETDLSRNGHFDPMHRECQFCHFDYNYYVHMETIKSDIAFIYESVNTTLISAMDDEEDTMRDKAGDIIHQRDSGDFKACEDACTMIDRAWWTFHARGLLASDVKQPMKGESCDSISKKEFEDLVWRYHVESKDRIDKRKQRHQAMIDIYLQVPLLDRLKVRDIFYRDFALHGYESTPPDMFPELERNLE